jgi:hypothetical protein
MLIGTLSDPWRCVCWNAPSSTSASRLSIWRSASCDSGSGAEFADLCGFSRRWRWWRSAPYRCRPRSPVCANGHRGAWDVKPEIARSMIEIGVSCMEAAAERLL